MKAPEIWKVIKTRKEYATANSELNPIIEKRNINVASRVPRPEIEIGMKLMRLEIAINKVKVPNPIFISIDFEIR